MEAVAWKIARLATLSDGGISMRGKKEEGGYEGGKAEGKGESEDSVRQPNYLLQLLRRELLALQTRLVTLVHNI
jgi:hypothetical protein